MAKVTHRQHLSRQYSTINLWIGLFASLLLWAILLESVCLGILYVSDSLRNKDISAFAKTHLLTRLFVSTPTNPVPGTKFLGTLGPDGWEWAQFHVADDLLGWRLAAKISVFHEPKPDTKYFYITDDNGFIADLDDPPVTLEKSVDAYRVIILGGSTVMGFGAPRPSQNIVGMLRKGVRDRGLTGPNGRHVELINAGVDSYNSAQEYLYLVSDLLRFKPDLVVAYDGWNDSRHDFNNNVTPLRTWPHGETQRRIAKSYSISGSIFLVTQNLKDFLTSSSSKLGMIELPQRVFNKLRSQADGVRSSLPPFDPRNIEYFDLNRRAFLALADDQLSVALFLQPVVGTDDRTLSSEEKASWWHPRFDELLETRVPFYEHARHILASLKARDQRNGHYCIADLSHSLKGVSEPVYADTGHLLPKGNEIVAAQILDQLVLCGLLR